MGRVGAFLIHLGISLLIFAVLAAVVVFVWYPDFFFHTDGGWQGIRIIAVVDIVLGPTLTLIVFNSNKPRGELGRDLSMIGALQLVCLVAGVFVVYSERPLALVYSDGFFVSVTADDFHGAGLDVPQLSHFPGSWPKQLMVDLPDDPGEQSNVRRAAVAAGRPLRVLAALYARFDLADIDIDKEAIPSATLEAREGATGDLAAWIKDHGGKMDDYAFFPFGARYGYLILGIDRSDGTITGLLNTQIERARDANVETAAQ